MIKTALLLLALTVGTLSAKAQPFGYTPIQVQSLFNSEFRNQQYDQALLYGRWLVEAHPKNMEDFPGNYRGDRNFSRMIDIYEHFANQQSDPALREAYLDSSLQMYERVLAIFTEDEIDVYRWHFNRGRFLQSHSDHIEDGYQRALDDYETMFIMDTQRATESGRGYYVQLLIHNYVRLDDRESVFRIMSMAEPYADQALLDYFAETRNELITDPHERIELLSEELENDPDNLSIILEIYELYQAIGNREKSLQTAELLYEKDPSVENITRLADKALNDADYPKANRYLAEAHSKQEGTERARSSLRIAENQLSMRNLQEARRFAQRAAREDPSWGEPFVLIAQIYGEAISRCAGSDMTRSDRAVYWLVLDYLDRAKQRNAGVTSTVNRLYRTYQPVTPSVEDKFYQGWTTGETLRVDGSLRECYSWINEDTTIR